MEGKYYITTDHRSKEVNLTLVGVMVTLPGTRPPTEGGALAAAGDTVKPLGVEAVEGAAAARPRRFAEARCCCRRRWSGVITCIG